jgi:hypothetical protein
LLDSVFYEGAGNGVKDNVLFQDNKSSILLEKNGKASSSKRTKHISIPYFFITNRVKTEEVSVVWCPTGDMIGDFATKPLQGALIRKFRDQIMGVTPARSPGPGKTDSNVGKIKTSKNKPKKGKATRLVPPGKKVAPQECVGSRTRDRSKGEPGLVKKDIRSSGSGDLQPGKKEVLTISDQSRGKTKKSSLLHLTSTE